MMERDAFLRKAESKEMFDAQVYRLCGADVMYVLEDMHLMDKLSEEEIDDVIGYVGRKLEIPWTEYIEAVVDMYMWRKEEVSK